ncbi:type VII toxin-antitoxin system HepT family RNase toxin [Marinomonas sp.]|uniref:type VII toxin-antitoxin system HepT family RNase toxin n=1 Tax=Marinomonas sp. TaxID=1904862 RepID=UPI003BAD1178
MSDSFYISAIRSNAKRYESELNELHSILSRRNLSTFEYRACERTLQVSIEAAIGVAKQVTKLLSGVSSVDAYQSFEVLSQHGFISLESLNNWRKVIGLRNALVHDYLNIDPVIVRSVVGNEYYQDVFSFIEEGLKKLASGF